MDERAEMDAEDEPWQPSDVVDFARNHEVDPRSADALFKIGHKRLLDIKDHVENDDFSIRADLKSDDSEEKLQKWLANQLRDRSRDRYKVVREEEVDRKKKPDIRLHVPGLQPTTIEIKWAHDWSFTELSQALSDQLVDQYMRSNNSRHGILVLANAELGRTWKPEPARSLDFESVVSELREQAQAIYDSRRDIDALKVFGIDFTV
ncbi:MAG: hypothetical protein GVY18_17550 [Bacteroidetes bacterium]|nr:hypothetical protein [Bacteroidota bacterium]